MECKCWSKNQYLYLVLDKNYHENNFYILFFVSVCKENSIVCGYEEPVYHGIITLELLPY